MKKNIVASAAVAAIALCGAGAAQAQAAGQILLQGGWNKIMPKVQSDDLTPPGLPGSKIGVQSASALLLTLTYMYTDHFSAEILGGLPYKHDLVATGSASGTGKIGSIHQVSPTLLFQYRFMDAAAPFRPYLGAGPTWVKFYGSEGSAGLTAVTNPGGPPTIIHGESDWGASIQAGANYKIDKHWFVDASIIKTWVGTTSRLSTGQSVHVDLNPVSVNATIGYAF